MTDRHLRRIFADAFGVSPLAWLNTRRLLQAKQMLTDTALSVTDVAQATGFGSLRRFNAAFAEHYRLSPRALRKASHTEGGPPPATPVTARLGYRPPYDIAGMRRFLGDRALRGIEIVSAEAQSFEWRRTLALDHEGQRLRGWFGVRLGDGLPEVHLTLAPTLVPALGKVVQGVRRALDLDADPALVDPVLARLPAAPREGLRLPGSVDGFESAARIILGQQVSVAAARTLTRRLVEAFGEPLDTPWPELNRLFPDAHSLCTATPDSIGRLGIVRQRVGALQALARGVAEGRLQLHAAAPLESTLTALRQLPDVGEWTVQLIAMRVLGWPDAFPATDIGLLNALGTRDLKQVQTLAEAWRPWRAYAVIRLWQLLET